jgi:hypothetical protein
LLELSGARAEEERLSEAAAEAGRTRAKIEGATRKKTEPTVSLDVEQKMPWMQCHRCIVGGDTSKLPLTAI